MGIKLAGRKFWATMYFQSSMFLLLYMGKIPADTFEFLTMIIFGAYIGGNVGAKYVGLKSGGSK